MKTTISKTFKFGPINLTLSPSGITTSIGVPGARVSLDSKGRAGLRLGKKGLSYTKKLKIL